MYYVIYKSNDWKKTTVFKWIVFRGCFRAQNRNCVCLDNVKRSYKWCELSSNNVMLKYCHSYCNNLFESRNKQSLENRNPDEFSSQWICSNCPIFICLISPGAASSAWKCRGIALHRHRHRRSCNMALNMCCSVCWGEPLMLREVLQVPELKSLLLRKFFGYIGK